MCTSRDRGRTCRHTLFVVGNALGAGCLALPQHALRTGVALFAVACVLAAFLVVCTMAVVERMFGGNMSAPCNAARPAAYGVIGEGVTRQQPRGRLASVVLAPAYILICGLYALELQKIFLPEHTSVVKPSFYVVYIIGLLWVTSTVAFIPSGKCLPAAFGRRGIETVVVLLTVVAVVLMIGTGSHMLFRAFRGSGEFHECMRDVVLPPLNFGVHDVGVATVRATFTCWLALSFYIAAPRLSNTARRENINEYGIVLYASCILVVTYLMWTCAVTLTHTRHTCEHLNTSVGVAETIRVAYADDVFAALPIPGESKTMVSVKVFAVLALVTSLVSTFMSLMLMTQRACDTHWKRGVAAAGMLAAASIAPFAAIQLNEFGGGFHFGAYVAGAALAAEVATLVLYSWACAVMGRRRLRRRAALLAGTAV